MIKIKKVILKNFQSHKYTELEFDSGLNAIVGQTDSGKTAILRGIKWALYNEPTGTFFIREGERDTSVVIEFDNGVAVERFRTPSKNGYKLIYKGEEKEFQGFGVGVPKEIREATQMEKINFGNDVDSAINIAEQLEGPFLLSESPRTRAAAVGKLVESDVIDHALADTNLDLRRGKSRQSDLNNDLKSLDKELVKYEYLQDLEKTIKKLENLEKKILKNEAILSSLSIIKEKLIKNKSLKAEQKSILASLEKLGKIEIALSELQSKSIKKNNYNRLLKQYIENDKSIKRYKNILNSLKEMDKLSESLDIATKKTNKLLDLRLYYKNLETYSNRIKSGYNTIDLLKDINQIDNKIYNLTDNINRYNLLSSKLLELSKKSERIANGKKVVDKLVVINKIEKEFKLLEQKITRVSKLEIINKNIVELKKEKIKFKKIKSSNKNLVIEKTNLLKETLKKSKVCPTCLRTLGEHDIDNVIESIG